MIPVADLKPFLDGLYYVYNRRELVNPDPLMFLYLYDDIRDREVAGLVASCLAYGRVAQILKSVEAILKPLGQNPYSFIRSNADALPALYATFKHRFTTGADMAKLLTRTSYILKNYDTLENFMGVCLRERGGLTGALDLFSTELEPERSGFSLLPSTKDGSACKRLFLFLKWMVRHDDVDPGGWSVLKPKDLIMPTDTHIHALSLRLGFTKRKQADLTTAFEITKAIAQLSPDDPTRYDFVLSRFGIRSGLSKDELVQTVEGQGY